MAQLRRLMEHGLTVGVIHGLLFQVILVQIGRSSGQIIGFNRLPQRLVLATSIFLKVLCILVVDPGIVFVRLRELVHERLRVIVAVLITATQCLQVLMRCRIQS